MKTLWPCLFFMFLLVLVFTRPVQVLCQPGASQANNTNQANQTNHASQADQPDLADQAGACPGAIISSHRVTARYEGDLHDEGLDDGLYLQLRQEDGTRLLVRTRDGLPMPEFSGRVGQLVVISYTLREYWAGQVGECVRENVFASASFPAQGQPDRALNDLRRQAENGDAVAALRLGLLYADGGQGLGRDPVDAYYWYSVAASSGSLLAMHYLGNCHRDGLGTDRDLAEAFRLYEKAAHAGLPVAYKDLGDCYLNGVGVAEDRIKARQMYQKACELGNHEAGIVLEALGVVAASRGPGQIARLPDGPGRESPDPAGQTWGASDEQKASAGDFMTVLGEYRLSGHYGQDGQTGMDHPAWQERESPGRMEIFRTVGGLDGEDEAEDEPYFLVALLDQPDGGLLRLGEGLRPRPAGRGWQIKLKSGNLCQLERKAWQTGATLPAGTNGIYSENGLPYTSHYGLQIICAQASPLDGLWLPNDSSDTESKKRKPAVPKK